VTTNCVYCGEELWGPAERFGVCSYCKDIEDEMRDPEPDDHDDECADCASDAGEPK